MHFIGKFCNIIINTLLLSLFVWTQNGWSQQLELTSAAEVSVITAGPGNELYEGFGHSTIRIIDKNMGFDLAYNYGIFDFDAPNFYLNFTKGKMLYKLQSYPFPLFVRSYQNDRRWIKEQILNLNLSQKQQFFEYLERNARPENASYFYDPFFNNCATKIPEITKLILKDKVEFNAKYVGSKQSLRQLMNSEIPWNTWGSFGINLALGSKLDKIAEPQDYLYLPDYIFSAFEYATIKNNGKNEKLVKQTRTLLNYEELQVIPETMSPLLFFIGILFIGLFITYQDFKNKIISTRLDFILFFSTGLLGFVICFLWFLTDHSTTPNNFNILWAFAPNVFVAFILKNSVEKKWFKYYLMFLILLIFSAASIWILKIQLMPKAVLPFLVLLMVRYSWLLKNCLLTSKK
uniref:lipoprotein N-acyltransferase Lnb domain-containing protein n=1 Tax=Polaribacter sp. TaxID=1920175 RepID=UPI0040470DD7